MTPVDLDEARDAAVQVENNDYPDTSRLICDMADEIDTWRTMFTAYDKANSADSADAACAYYDKMIALLPPDAKGRGDAV